MGGLKSIPFADVITKVAELSEGNHDETRGTSALTFVKEEAHPHGALVVGGDEGGDGDVLPLTAMGFATMSKQLGVPARYMQKLDAEEEAKHVNMWLRDEDTTWQLRMNGAGGVRSVQKAGFTPIDILPTLEAIQPVIDEEGLVVTHVVPNLDDFHLRCVWPASHGNGDPLHAGFHMNATEANLHLFTVDAACYRSLCLNTAILRRDKALFSQRHYFLNFDEFRPRLLEGLQRVRVVGHNLCDALERCRNEAMNQADMQAELKRLLNMKALPKRFVEQASEAVEEGRVEEATRYGLINMVTREAQEFGQGERKFVGRMRVESVAGRMLLEHMGSTIASSAPISEETTTTAVLEVGDDDEPESLMDVADDGTVTPVDKPTEEPSELETEMRAALEAVPGDESEPEEKPKKKKKVSKKAKKRVAKKKRKKAAKKRKAEKKAKPEPEPEADEPEADEPEADEPEADEPEADETDIEDAEEYDDDETAEHDEADAEDAEEPDEDEEEDAEEDDEEDAGEEDEETEDEDGEESDDEDDVEESEESDEEEDDPENLDDILSNDDDLEPVEA